MFDIPRSVLHRMRNVSDKSHRENQDILFSVIFFENHAVYEITCTSIVEPDRPKMTIWHMRVAAGYPRPQTDTPNM